VKNRKTMPKQTMWAVAASICIMLPLWFVMNPMPDGNATASSAPENFDTLNMMSALAKLDEDEIEIVQELEFILWLNQQDNLDDYVVKST